MVDLIADPFRAARLVLALRQEGVTHDTVIQAMEAIDRAAFVAPQHKALASENCVLPIECGQIIPRPATTAFLLQALDVPRSKDSRILVIGAGSGYTMALAAQLGDHVFGVERYARLVETTRLRLSALGLDKLHVRLGDGFDGWPERGPFDRILLTGAVNSVSETLLRQLGRGGTLIAPVASGDGQVLYRYDDRGERQAVGRIAGLPPFAEGVSRQL